MISKSTFFNLLLSEKRSFSISFNSLSVCIHQTFILVMCNISFLSNKRVASERGKHKSHAKKKQFFLKKCVLSHSKVHIQIPTFFLGILFPDKFFTFISCSISNEFKKLEEKSQTQS